jgi:hypothetical protein
MKRVLKTVLIWPDLSKQKALVMREQCECSSVQNDSVTLCEVVAFFPVWFQFTQKHDWIFTHMIGESFRRCTCFGLVVNEISLSGGYKRFGRNNCLRLQGWLCKNSADNIPNLHGHENKVGFFSDFDETWYLEPLLHTFIPCQFDSRQWPLTTTFYLKSQNELEAEDLLFELFDKFWK